MNTIPYQIIGIIYALVVSFLILVKILEENKYRKNSKMYSREDMIDLFNSIKHSKKHYVTMLCHVLREDGYKPSSIYKSMVCFKYSYQLTMPETLILRMALFDTSLIQIPLILFKDWSDGRKTKRGCVTEAYQEILKWRLKIGR